MKKIITLTLVAAMLFAFVSCGKADRNEKPEDTTEKVEQNDNKNEETNKDGTVGEILLADFKANAKSSAQDIADKVFENSVIGFMPATMPVEEGYLNGFNEEIKGFKEGVMFGPAIGTIPFVGYVFVLEDGADVESFKTTLKDNANLRWNICTMAEEMVCESEGNTVFFLMCPTSFEQPEEGDDAGIGDMDMGVGDMEIPAEDGIAAEDGITLE